MNIILGQSFSTRSVIPQLVIVTTTIFLDFNTRTYKEKNLEDVPSRVCTLKKKNKKLKCFHWHNWEATTSLLFMAKKICKDGNFSSFTLFRNLAGLKGKWRFSSSPAHGHPQSQDHWYWWIYPLSASASWHDVALFWQLLKKARGN